MRSRSLLGRRQHAKLLRDVADYLDERMDGLAKDHRNPVTRRIEPVGVRAELTRVRRWSKRLRAAALQELVD